MHTAQRLYSGFPAAAGRHSPTNGYMRTARNYVSNPTGNLFGSIDESIFQARAEAALVAGMEMKAAGTGAAMFRPTDMLSYHVNSPYLPAAAHMPMSSQHAEMSLDHGAPIMGVDQHTMMCAPQFAQYAPVTMTPLAPVSLPSGQMRYPAGLASMTAAATGEPDTDPRELERFAEHFKQRRIKLGVTQADVGKALAHLKMPGVGSLSQSTICRFESLTLSHNNMVALKPILHAWLERAEEVYKTRTDDDDGFSGASGILPNVEKKRKRTSIAAPEKRHLETYFQLQPRPSGEKIAAIAEKLDLKKNVVRVWFCNQRQKQKRCRNQANGRGAPKCSPGGYFTPE